MTKTEREFRKILGNNYGVEHGVGRRIKITDPSGKEFNFSFRKTPSGKRAKYIIDKVLQE